MSEPIRSFCARTIILCQYVKDYHAGKTDDINVMKTAAIALEKEAEQVQDHFGGRLDAAKGGARVKRKLR